MSTNMKVINLGGVNCYLFSASDRFVLVDSGFISMRGQLVKELEAAGVKPGTLALIILTHGDIDHIGSAAYLREAYGAKIAMHREDAGVVEQDKTRTGRNARPDKISFAGLLIILLGSFTTLIKGTPVEKFSPDLYLEDGQSLVEYGLDACVVHLPGHSRGSIGILTPNSDLICGDLLWNMRKPGLHFLVDDLTAHQDSIHKLDRLKIRTVYPGHGNPFLWGDFKHG